MSDQEIQRDIAQDEALAIKRSFKKLTLIAKLKQGFKSFFKKVVLKLKLKIKAHLDKMKKLFIRQEEDKAQKRAKTTIEEDVCREIPSVLKDVADLDNKVDLFVKSHHEPGFERSTVNYAIIERLKAEEHKKHLINSSQNYPQHIPEKESLERKSPIERLSSNSIDAITAEIMKNNKIKSFIERELSRGESGSARVLA